jgi:hypothetical protein
MGALGRAGSGAARSWGLVDRGVGGAGAPCVWFAGLAMHHARRSHCDRSACSATS